MVAVFLRLEKAKVTVSRRCGGAVVATCDRCMHLYLVLKPSTFRRSVAETRHGSPCPILSAPELDASVIRVDCAQIISQHPDLVNLYTVTRDLRQILLRSFGKVSDFAAVISRI